MKKMFLENRISGKSKRILAGALVLLLSLSSFTGCGKRTYEEPELMESLVVAKIFRHPEIRDLKEVNSYEGVVVPKDYPAFYKNITRLSSIEVKVGDYVERGDVIAYGVIENYGNTSEDWGNMISNETTVKGLQNSVSNDQIELENINRKTSSESGNSEGVAAADKQISLLGEDKRYNNELSDYKVGRYTKAKAAQTAKEEEAVLVADHSGYVTFIKDISTDDMAKAYENVAVISDMNELYIEAEGISADEYTCEGCEEKYTYINGKKVEIKELDYADDMKSLAEVTKNKLPMRFTASANLKAGDNMLLVFKKTKAEKVLAVGSGAVISEGLSRYVYVRKDGEDIEKRTVEVGYSNGNYTEIKYGLTEEDEVYYPLNQFYPVNYKEMEIATGDVAVGAMSKFILGKNSKIKGYYTDFPGQLQEICVSQDDEVKKGDLLFTYTTENTSAKIKEVTESIKVLKENHASTLEMYEGMKEAYEQNDTGVSTIGAAEGATAGDAFSKEKHDLNFEIIDYRIQIENVNYDYSLKTLTAKYNELTKDNDGSGLISVYAESDGIIKNVDDEAVVGKVFKGRQYIVSIAEPGVNETLVQMREMKTSAYGASEPEPTGNFKSAPVGKAINVKIGNREMTGRAIGVNGNKTVYDTYSDGKPVFTTCTPGPEYRDQFYADIDGEIDYEDALRDKNSVEITFLAKDYKGIPLLDKGVIYTTYIGDKPKYYVWKEVDGELVMQYITIVSLGDDNTGDVAVIDGVEVGDKIIREVTPAVEEE